MPCRSECWCRVFLVLLVCLLASALSAPAQPCDPVEVDKLVGVGGVALEQMGAALAVEGDLLAAGTAEADAVYVFRRSAGVWSQEARLTPAGASADPGFGASVAVWGDRVVVGAPRDFGASGTDSGAVYVFRSSAGVWTQEARLTPFGAGFNDDFGHAVAAREGLILAGAPGDVIGPFFAAGSVRVFELDALSSAWTEVGVLTARTVQPTALFGFSIAVDGPPGGEAVVVGAPFALSSPGVESGRAYLFRREPGTLLFIGEGEFDYPSVHEGDQSGRVVGVSGDAAVIGAPGDRKASYYRFGPGGITHEITATRATVGEYPAALAIDGDVALLGSPDINDASGLTYGARYVNGQWSGIVGPRLSASDADAGDRFGAAVAFRGDDAFVGAPSDDENGTDAGAVYVFDLGCTLDCPADVNGDGLLTPADFNAWIVNYNAGCERSNRSSSMSLVQTRTKSRTSLASP